MQVKSYRKEYGRPWIFAMPTNLDGPNDNFGLKTSHVLPELIRTVHEGKMNAVPSLTLWRLGKPLREILNAYDVAREVLHLSENYDDGAPSTIEWGKDMSIPDLAPVSAVIGGFEGAIAGDSDKPDGTPRKLLDRTKLNSSAWYPDIGLCEGIKNTYKWYLGNHLNRNYFS